MDTEHKMETKLVVDCLTNTVEEIELSKADIAQRLEDQNTQAKQEADLLAQIAAKEGAKADLLAKLGITADEAKLLLG
jgi:hypothetical protein